MLNGINLFGMDKECDEENKKCNEENFNSNELIAKKLSVSELLRIIYLLESCICLNLSDLLKTKNYNNIVL